MIYFSLYETVSLKRCVMKIKFLLFGTSLSFIPLTVNAQCVVTQDCVTLGYTETSCNGGKGVKCPFGNKWACLLTEAEICKKNGFTESCTGTGQSGSGKSCGGLYAECSCASSYQYACTGTGYAGGAGSACGGKYTQCMCSSGYEWKNGSCQQKITDGPAGDLYYCNGAVVAVKAPGMNFYVAMKDLGTMEWIRANSSCQNYSFCDNLKGALPSKEQLLTMYKNKSLLKSLLLTNGGIALTNGWYWSSTGSTGYSHLLVDMSNGLVRDYYLDYVPYVRPVLVDY